MILQIMTKGVFSAGFVPFMQNGFDEDIRFILVEREKSSLDDALDDVAFDEGTTMVIHKYSQLYSDKRCREWVSRSDAIILNWVDGTLLALLLPYISKMGVLFWGADLQSLKQGVAQGDVVARIKKKLIERVPCIITLLPGDYTELCSFSSPRGKWFLGVIWSDILDKAQLRPSRQEQMLGRRFLVGNSATCTNRHIEVFEQLARFLDDGIEVYAPLSYGSDEYRQTVLREGRRLFGDGFKPLLGFMEYSSYADFLGTVSVAVFNHTRQQGMGNIRTLLAQGAKVYLSEEGPMLEDFIREGYEVFRTEDLQNQSYGDVVFFSESSRLKTRELGSFEAQHDRALELWGEIFDYLESLRS